MGQGHDRTGKRLLFIAYELLTGQRRLRLDIRSHNAAAFRKTRRFPCDHKHRDAFTFRGLRCAIPDGLSDELSTIGVSADHILKAVESSMPT